MHARSLPVCTPAIPYNRKVCTLQHYIYIRFEPLLPHPRSPSRCPLCCAPTTACIPSLLPVHPAALSPSLPPTHSSPHPAVFYWGFAFLPLLWFVNVWLFWYEFRATHAAADLHIKKCEKRLIGRAGGKGMESTHRGPDSGMHSGRACSGREGVQAEAGGGEGVGAGQEGEGVRAGGGGGAGRRGSGQA